MNRRLLTAVAFAVLLWLGAARAAAEVSGTERWLEILERYELPMDPDWFATTKFVAKEFGLESEREAARSRGKPSGLSRPGGLLGGPRGSDLLARFRSATGSVEMYGEFKRRLDRAGDNDRSRDAVFAAIEKEVDRIVSSGDSARKLTVIRAWDGIARASTVYVMGDKQRAVAGRCTPGSVVLAETGASNCADHGQSNGRPTITSVKSKPTPSEFLKFEASSAGSADLRFGASECPSDWIGTAVKSEVVGSGELLVSFELPAAIDIDTGFPWYCEFKIMELDSTGAPVKEVRFEGPAQAVCVTTLPRPAGGGLGGSTGRRQPDAASQSGRPAYRSLAQARVNVSRPGPYGYVAIATGLFAAHEVPMATPPQEGTPAGEASQP